MPMSGAFKVGCLMDVISTSFLNTMALGMEWSHAMTPLDLLVLPDLGAPLIRQQSMPMLRDLMGEYLMGDISTSFLITMASLSVECPRAMTRHNPLLQPDLGAP